MLCHPRGMNLCAAAIQYIIPQLLGNSPFAAAVKVAGYVCADEFKNYLNYDVRMQTVRRQIRETNTCPGLRSATI